MTLVGTEAAPAMVLKKDLWEETHKATAQCPHCQRSMSIRYLRWKHICRRPKEPQVIADAEQAEKRRRDLEQLALDTLNKRLRRREARAEHAEPGGGCTEASPVSGAHTAAAASGGEG